ncbi:MAG: hypothetical protein AAF637_08755 [Pseudomonadota bacterium]
MRDVLTFTFADEALARLKTNPDLEVGVVFLDINMPRVNRFEFLEAAIDQIRKFLHPAG